MGQLFDRLGKFIKSEFRNNDYDTIGIIPNDGEELKRIIDELNKKTHYQNHRSKKDNSDSTTNSQHHTNHSDNSPRAGTMDRLKAFAILEIDANSNYEQIKAAYLKKIKEYHPDKVANLGEELKILAHRKTQEINSAYNFLKNNNYR